MIIKGYDIKSPNKKILSGVRGPLPFPNFPKATLSFSVDRSQRQGSFPQYDNCKKGVADQKSIKEDFKVSYNGKTYRNLYKEYLVRSYMLQLQHVLKEISHVKQ
jgi:hypothetical protein